jgi:hypothetical protein
MVAFHRHLITGAGPARALRRAGAEAAASGQPHRLEATALFLAIGAGR